MTDALQTSERSLFERLMIAGGTMLATVMIILDMTVVNVALPHMMGALGATPDQITWVLTSYIVAEAVTIPMSGFLAERFGRRHIMLVSVAGFVVTSMACGQASSLTEMVLFRLLQGVFGASVIPLSQSIMIDTFSKENQGKAMAVWGIGIMLGPIMGPTIGGLITESLNWRWVFYINLPVGLINLVILSAFLPDTQKKAVGIDWLGAAMLVVGVGALQTFLDRGNTDEWFQSQLITAMFALAWISIIAFLWRSWGRSDALLRIDLLRDRNLASSSFMMLAFGLGMFGTIALQPIFIEQLLNYPANITGLIMAPRGLAAATGMALVAVLINRVAARWLVLIGLILSAAGSYAMTVYNLQVGTYWLVMPGVVQGLGMGMMFVPLSALAFQTIPKELTDRAAGLFNLARTIGSSMGIAIAATVLTRTTNINWQVLGGHINPYNPNLYSWLAAKGLSLSSPLAPQMLASELSRQSSMLGFVDAFYFISISFVLLIPLVLLLKGGRVSGGMPVG